MNENIIRQNKWVSRKQKAKKKSEKEKSFIFICWKLP